MKSGQTKHGEQAEALYKQMAQQLDEHKAWLRQQVANKLVTQAVIGASVEMVNRRGVQLLNMINEITFVRAAPEKVATSEGVGVEISVTYDYPDALFDWLQTHLPEALAGGAVVEKRATKHPSNRS